MKKTLIFLPVILSFILSCEVISGVYDKRKNTDVYLSDLTVSKGKLQPVFNRDTTGYLAAPVPYSDTSVVLTLKAENKKATILVNGAKVSSGDAITINNLAVGPNVSTLKVTDESGEHSGIYTVCIYRAVPVYKTGAGTGTVYTMDPREDGHANMRWGTAWPATRFTAATSTVTDNMTGLVWLRNANNAGGTKYWTDGLAYVQGLNTGSGTAGYTNWRLPNVLELSSMVNYGRSDAHQWLMDQNFTSVQNDVYWSSTSNAGSVSIAWLVNMSTTLSNMSKTGWSAYLWPVTGSSEVLPLTGAGDITGYTLDSLEDGYMKKGLTWPSIRFCENSDGTVTDNMTGLMWMKNANMGGKKAWANAFDYIDSLNSSGTCGYTDWRLPNAREIITLSNYGTDDIITWLTGQGFTGLSGSNMDYWTSTTNAGGSTRAWLARFAGGGILIHSGVAGLSFLKTDPLYVWPVRGGVR